MSVMIKSYLASFLCVTYTLYPKVHPVTLNSDNPSLEIGVFLWNYVLPEIHLAFRYV
jgi:hypothetical protein